MYIKKELHRGYNPYLSTEPCSETPGDAVIADALAYTGDSQEVFRLPIIRQILEQGGKDFLDVSIQGTANPTDRGHLIKSGENINGMS